MTLVSKRYESYTQRGQEKYYLNREQLIEDICTYVYEILEYRHAIIFTELHETQLKKPRGKHKDINPYAKAPLARLIKSGDFEWRSELRGYRGIYKWYVFDSDMSVLEHFITPTQMSFNIENQMEWFHYGILQNLPVNDLIGICFALITYLHRYQPLESSEYKDYDKRLSVMNRLEKWIAKTHKKIPKKRIMQNMAFWLSEEDFRKWFDDYNDWEEGIITDKDKKWILELYPSMIETASRHIQEVIENPKNHKKSYRKALLKEVKKTHLKHLLKN